MQRLCASFFLVTCCETCVYVCPAIGYVHYMCADMQAPLNTDRELLLVSQSADMSGLEAPLPFQSEVHRGENIHQQAGIASR